MIPSRYLKKKPPRWEVSFEHNSGHEYVTSTHIVNSMWDVIRILVYIQFSHEYDYEETLNAALSPTIVNDQAKSAAWMAAMVQPFLLYVSFFISRWKMHESKEEILLGHHLKKIMNHEGLELHDAVLQEEMSIHFPFYFNLIKECVIVDVDLLNYLPNETVDEGLENELFTWKSIPTMYSVESLIDHLKIAKLLNSNLVLNSYCATERELL